MMNESLGRRNSKQDDDNFGKLNGGVWFYVNRNSFPINDATWNQMWHYASKIHPDGSAIENGIRSQRNLPEVPMPHVPLSFAVSVSVPERLESIQKYLKRLQYNHTGTQFFDIKKHRPICGLMDRARDMIRESLPIKCLEAVILAIYLTNYFPGLDRFPISFRSICRGNVHRHVVLGLHYNGRYGALGMSRREDLMYKALESEHLSQVISDFNNCYKKCGHVLDKVKIGLTIPHDSHTYESIQWKGVTLNMKKWKAEELAKEIDRFSREIRRQPQRWQSSTCINLFQKPRSCSPKRPLHQSSQSADTIRTDVMESRLMRDRRMLAAAMKNHQPSHFSSNSQEKRLTGMEVEKKDTTTEIYALRI